MFMALASGKEPFIRFTASVFRKLLSIYVFSYFSFGFEGRMWDLIVPVPVHCLSFCSVQITELNKLIAFVQIPICMFVYLYVC